MKFDVNTILTDLQEGALDAAKTVTVAFLKEAAADATAFVAAALPFIERYINLLIAKQISQAEFKSLMYGLRDLAELNGLTVAGLFSIQVEKTRDTMLKAVTSIALGAVNKIA